MCARASNLNTLKSSDLAYSFESYSFEENKLFSKITFDLEAGQVMQVLGRNGKGKTTLLRILAGLLMPLEGQVLWKGRCIHKFPENYRTDLIYIGHLLALKAHLTPFENLELSARLRGYEVSRNAVIQALTEVGLEQHYSMTYQLSAGQRQRLALARLLITPSQLWILDEPFNVLCKQGQDLFKAWIEQYLHSGGSVILTSHHPIHFNQFIVKTLTL